MRRWELYQQIYLLGALYYGCRNSADWDAREDMYIQAINERYAKMRWLRNLNRVKKEAWFR